MDHCALIFPMVHRLIFIYQVDNGCRFASARGTVKEQIGEIILGENVLKEFAVNGVQHNIVELARSIFFDPRYVCLFYARFLFFFV